LSTAEAFSTSLSAIVANKAVLANTVFPIDLTPVSGVLVAQCTMAVGLGVILAAGAVLGLISWTAPLALAIWGLLLLALIGMGWILALLNVLVRDLQHLVTMVIMLLLIASPIGYTPEQVPDRLQAIIVLNPFAYFVRGFQDVLVFGEVPSLKIWVAMVVIAAVVFVGGAWLFDRLKLVVVDYV
jgi:lipopolysaccharide transport system permease protein